MSKSCDTPGLPVHHQLPEFTQTHLHWVGDAIQRSHPLSSSSPPAFNFSQHQGLFKWVSSLHQVTKVLEFQLQHQSFQWILRTLGWTGWISLQSKRFSRVFSNTTVQKHQFFIIQLSSFLFLFFLLYFTLQYCIGFAIHWHESAKGVHEFPILRYLGLVASSIKKGILIIPFSYGEIEDWTR